jgi:hypothetical protein
LYNNSSNQRTQHDIDKYNQELSDQEIEVLLHAVMQLALRVDYEFSWWLNSTNIEDFVRYQYEEVNQHKEARDIFEDNYGFFDDVGVLDKDADSRNIQSRNVGLISLLLGVGVAAAAVYSLYGSVITIQGAVVIAPTFPPFSTAIALGIVAAALVVIAGIIYANWDKIAPVIDQVRQYIVDAAGMFGNLVGNYTQETSVQAKESREVLYQGVKYMTKGLSQDIQLKNMLGKFYLIFGKKSYSSGGTSEILLVVGFVGASIVTGGIKRETALKVMRHEPNIYYENAPGYNFSMVKNNIVISIYTFLESDASDIAREAGGVAPVWHQAKNQKGHFDHYHNGAMIAKYPKLNDKGEFNSLPHAFYGMPYAPNLTTDMVEY